MLAKRLIKSNDAGGGACTNTVDLYNPFPDGGGVALYQLNGDATDVSGNYNGTWSGTEAYGTGVFGQAASFNGSTKILTPINTTNFVSNLNDRNVDFSISLWINPSVIPSTGEDLVFYIGNYTTISPQYHTIQLQLKDGSLRFSIYEGVTEHIILTSSLVVGNWYNVVCIRESSVMKLYVNNSLIGQTTQTNNSSISSSTNLQFGDVQSAGAYYNGLLDQVRFFTRALRPYEVEALYTEEYCTPTIVPSEHFNTVTYTGNSSTQSVTGVGFQPDLVWIKRRNTTEDHALFDSVRGALKMISTNLTAAEYTTAAPYEAVSSFDSDGFTTGDNGATNRSPNTYVAWNFKAGGAAVTNTDGTITSQVSANTEAGFSVVSYTGNGANGTVGHGLGVTPNIVLTKRRNSTSNWSFNGNFGGLIYGTNKLALNDTIGISADTNEVLAANSNNFTAGTSGAVGASGGTYIAYCFAEVEGFSNFGSYVGTGASGNTIVTGFEPAFVMLKRTDVTGYSWAIADNKRVDGELLANSSDAERIENTPDFLENGFRLTTERYNDSGSKWIYMAFAADPTAVEPTLEDSFNTVLYNGNGGTNPITGVGFQPDLTWIKSRTFADNHILFDSIRGVKNNLYSNLTVANTPDSNSLLSFDNNGFTVGLNSTINSNGESMVAWNWKGAEIPAINSNGSIPSVVSANPAAGFSISTYSGKTGGGTTGHGLNSEPEFIIFKRYTAAQNWFVFAKINNVWHSFEGLNTSAAAVNYSPYFSANDSVINWYNINEYNSDPASKYLAYSFHSVAGFSKFGSYVGNANVNGPTVNLGFEPAFIMTKRTDSDTSGGNWLIFDNKRDTVNPNSKVLLPNLSLQELDEYGIDFNPTGFQIKATDTDINGLNKNYIYMAFANQF